MPRKPTGYVRAFFPASVAEIQGDLDLFAEFHHGNNLGSGRFVGTDLMDVDWRNFPTEEETQAFVREIKAFFKDNKIEAEVEWEWPDLVS